MAGIDFAAEDWHPTIDLPDIYDVLDLSGAVENVRMSDFSVGKYDEIRDIYTTELFAVVEPCTLGSILGVQLELQSCRLPMVQSHFRVQCCRW